MDNEKPPTSLEEQIRQAKAGCREALNTVLAFFRAYMLSYVHAHFPANLRVKEAPSDLVQESLLEASQDFSKFRGDTREELWAWLRQILHHNLGNLYRDFCECQKRDISREVRLDDPHGPHETQFKECIVDRGLSAEERAIKAEERLLLQQAFAQLAEKDQLVIRMSAWDKASFDEIATALGCSVAAACKAYGRALGRLAEIYRNLPGANM